VQLIWFRRKTRSDGLGIFFCSDVHGSTTCFKKFVNAATYYRQRGQPVHCLILGGDLTGKLIVPVIREDSHYRSYLLGREVELATAVELREFVKQCEMLGVYPNVFSVEEYEAFRSDSSLQEAVFRRLMLQRLEEWLAFAADRLRGLDVSCYILPGNDDIPEVDELLAQASGIINPDRKVVRLDDTYEMVSLGLSNPTPFECPRDVPEEELARLLDELASQVERLQTCIFTIHVPPFNSGLDLAPALDDELRPRIGPQGVEMAPVGSTAVREAILTYQPLLSLHGHIHESKGVARLGRTLCVNAGSEYSEGILRGALITLRDGEVASHLLVSG
jgi:Icc-related predicted phosphoesterase